MPFDVLSAACEWNGGKQSSLLDKAHINKDQLEWSILDKNMNIKAS